MNITNKGKKYTTANGGNIWGLKGEFTNLDQRSRSFVLIKGIKTKKSRQCGSYTALSIEEKDAK